MARNKPHQVGTVTLYWCDYELHWTREARWLPCSSTTERGIWVCEEDYGIEASYQKSRGRLVPSWETLTSAQAQAAHTTGAWRATHTGPSKAPRGT